MALGIEKASGLVESAVQGLAGTASIAATTDVSVASPNAGGITVAGDLVLPVDGLILDLRKPDQAVRQFLQQVREGLRSLEKEAAWAT
jgi:hypothetical protein